MTENDKSIVELVEAIKPDCIKCAGNPLSTYLFNIRLMEFDKQVGKPIVSLITDLYSLLATGLIDGTIPDEPTEFYLTHAQRVAHKLIENSLKNKEYTLLDVFELPDYSLEKLSKSEVTALAAFDIAMNKIFKETGYEPK